MTRRGLRAAAALAVLLLAGCDGTVDIPSLLRLQPVGTVRDAAGAPRAGVEVMLGGLRFGDEASLEPLSGATTTRTNERGEYALFAMIDVTRSDTNGACYTRTRRGEVRVVLAARDGTGHVSIVPAPCTTAHVGVNFVL